MRYFFFPFRASVPPAEQPEHDDEERVAGAGEGELSGPGIDSADTPNTCASGGTTAAVAAAEKPRSKQEFYTRRSTVRYVRKTSKQGLRANCISFLDTIGVP